MENMHSTLSERKKRKRTCPISRTHTIHRYMHEYTCHVRLEYVNVDVHVMEKYPSGYGCLWWFHCPGPTHDWWFLNKGPCPVYRSRRGRHYVGNDVVDESH